MNVSRAHTAKNRGPQPRKGATLVIVALLMTVLMMFAGFGIDFSRMYAYKAQLKVLADAAALSAAADLKNGTTEATANSRVTDLKSVNLVENTEADSVLIEPGRWDFTNEVFSVTSWSDADAIRATPQYAADWTIARIFGVNSRTLVESSVAAIGSYVSSACLAPIAIPYMNLLRAIDPANTDTSTVLDYDDIRALAQNNTEVQLTGTQDGDGDMLSPGWFALINLGDGNGNNQDVRDALDNALDGCLVGKVINTGDWIDVIPGTGGYNSNQQRWRDLCDGTPQMTNCQRIIQIPIVNSWNGASGTGAAWEVVYVAAIQLTRIVFPTGAAKPAEVHGIFTVDTQGGGSGFSQFPGPVQGIALVR